MINNVIPVGFKIGQQDRNGVEITVGSINDNPDALPALEICAYIPEAGAFCWLEPELYLAYDANGIDAFSLRDLSMLMILAKDQACVSINGTIKTRPEVLALIPSN